MTLNIQFFGAAGEVTGSCQLVTVGNQRDLPDCGLIQGGRKDEARNRYVLIAIDILIIFQLGFTYLAPQQSILVYGYAFCSSPPLYYSWLRWRRFLCGNWIEIDRNGSQ